jgi:hypothetical protein
MSSQLSHARQQRDSVLSLQECRAIRALDSDDDYTRSEIAFMMECQVGTVAHHADRECDHATLDSDERADLSVEYDDTTLLDALRVVDAGQPYSVLSQAVYAEYKPEDFPAPSTIARRFGGWQAARERAFGGDGDE